MSKSFYFERDSSGPSTDWDLFELSHSSRTPSAHDPRPLWQRLDDEEDRLLIERRNLIRRIRISVLTILGVAAFFWLISQ